MIDFSKMLRPPTKLEKKLYREWVKYLSNSKLDASEIHKRAAAFAGQHKRVPKDD